jgi:hypothetical protein
VSPRAFTVPPAARFLLLIWAIALQVNYFESMNSRRTYQSVCIRFSESKQSQEILNYPSDGGKKEGVGRICRFHGYLQLEKVVKPDFCSNNERELLASIESTTRETGRLLFHLP